jgi:hypothetical protein
VTEDRSDRSSRGWLGDPAAPPQRSGYPEWPPSGDANADDAPPTNVYAALSDLAPHDAPESAHVEPVPRDFAPPLSPWTTASDIGGSRVRLTPGPASADEAPAGDPRQTYGNVPDDPAATYGRSATEPPPTYGSGPAHSAVDQFNPYGPSAANRPDPYGPSAGDQADANGPPGMYGRPPSVPGGDPTEQFGRPGNDGMHSYPPDGLGGDAADPYGRSGNDPAAVYRRPSADEVSPFFGGGAPDETYARPPAHSSDADDAFERAWAARGERASYDDPASTNGALGVGYERPDAGYGEPAAGFRAEGADYDRPDDGSEGRGAGYDDPAASYGGRGVGYGRPDTGHGDPAASYGGRGVGYERPDDGYGDAAATYAGQGVGYQRPDAAYGDPAAGLGGPDSGFEGPAAGQDDREWAAAGGAAAGGLYAGAPGGGAAAGGAIAGGLFDGPGGMYDGPPRVEWVSAEETAVAGGAVIDLSAPRGLPVTHRGRNRRRRGIVVAAALGAVLAGGTGYAALRGLGLDGSTQKNAEVPLVTIAPTTGPAVPDDSPSIGLPSSAATSGAKTTSPSPSVSASATAPATHATTPGAPASTGVVVIAPPSPAKTNSPHVVTPTAPASSNSASAAAVTARFSQISDAQGLVGSVVVSDSGSVASGSWTMQVTIPGASAVVTTGGVSGRISGNVVSLSGPSIDAGDSLSFTFTVSGPLTGSASGCSINGDACN